MLRVTLVKNLRNKNIKMIEDFLNPIDINQYHQISSLPKQIIGKNIKIEPDQYILDMGCGNG